MTPRQARWPPRPARGARRSVRMCSALSVFGRTTPSRPGATMPATSPSVRPCVEPIDADRDEAAVKPRQRGLDERPRRDLVGIRDRVLQVEDDPVGAERGHLVDLARLIAGREEQAPQ